MYSYRNKTFNLLMTKVNSVCDLPIDMTLDVKTSMMFYRVNQWFGLVFN